MADDVLQSIADDLSSINKQLKVARDYLAVMKEAGEDTTAQESAIRQLEIRKSKWERTLENRGYKTS